MLRWLSKLEDEVINECRQVGMSNRVFVISENWSIPAPPTATAEKVTVEYRGGLVEVFDMVRHTFISIAPKADE